MLQRSRASGASGSPRGSTANPSVQVRKGRACGDKKTCQEQHECDRRPDGPLASTGGEQVQDEAQRRKGYDDPDQPARRVCQACKGDPLAGKDDRREGEQHKCLRNGSGAQGCRQLPGERSSHCVLSPRDADGKRELEGNNQRGDHGVQNGGKSSDVQPSTSSHEVMDLTANLPSEPRPQARTSGPRTSAPFGCYADGGSDSQRVSFPPPDKPDIFIDGVARSYEARLLENARRGVLLGQCVGQ